ncbi:MAG: ribosome small subunit-dependent GTPase A [Oscillospiraceae bacterium]
MSLKTIEARIKLNGGFYYADYEGVRIVCRARGKFRNDGISPVVGDIARIDVESDNTGYLQELLPRRNFLIRPNIANIDLLIMVLSVVEPPVNFGVTDRMLAICEYKNIPAAIVMTKADMEHEKAAEVAAIYRKAGYPVIITGENDRERSELMALMGNKLSVLTGNTGAGKSTLLNFLDGGLHLETGEISKKLGRGRHTTRTTGIFKVDTAFIADTPGFSSLETIRLVKIEKEYLQNCFIDFAPFRENCRFTGCSHRTEKGCAVLKAVEEGKISRSRHLTYMEMYEESAKLKDWE